MKNIFNKIIVILLIFISPAIAADKYKINPYTGKFDNTGPFTAGTLTGGSYCTYDAGTDTIICTSAGSGSTLPGGGQNAVQRNNGGTFTGDETQFSSNGTNVGLGTTNGNALFSINSTANQSLFRIDDNGINDASPAIYVKADGNVGIGTTNPMTNFQVGGGVTAGAEIEILSAAPELGFTETDTSKFWEIWVNASALRFSDSSDRMVIEGTNGNVGINTAIPPNKLYVAGTVEANGFKLNGQNGAAGSVLVSNSTGIGTWMPPSAIGANGGTVTSIATISPITGGTITGTGTIAIDNAVADGSTKGAASFTAADFDASSGNISLDYTNGQAASASNKGFLTSADWTTFNNKTSSQWLSSAGTGNVGINTTNRSVGIGTFMGAGALVVLPTQDGNLNVGIGTWNPVAQLEVIGTTKATALRATGISGSTQCVQADTNGNLSGTGSACGGAGSTPGGGQNAVQYNNASAFAGSEAVFSFNGTNVGIGTTNGIGALDVRSASAGLPSNNTTGNLRLIDTTAFAPGTGGELIFGGYYTSTDLASNATGIKTEKRNGASGDYGFGMSFWTRVNGDVPTRRMIVADDGNVGVGTAIPVTKLEIAGTSKMTGFQLNLAPLAGGNVLVSNTVGVGTWMSPTTLPSGGGSGTVNSGVVNQVTYYASTGTSVSGSTALGTDNTNVGIGTTSFTNRLNVLGNIGLGTTAYDAYVTQTVPSGSIAIQGNLGIGTFNPTGRFQLNNGVVTGGVLVSNGVGVGTWMAPGTLPGGAEVNNLETIAQGILDDEIPIGSAADDTVYSAVPDCDDSGGKHLNYDTDTNALSCGTSSSGGAGSNYWITGSGNGVENIGIGTTVNGVGIGTTFGTAQLAVMSGNVGIGTWVPQGALVVMNGNVGIGSIRPSNALAIQVGANNTTFTGQTIVGNVAGNFGISNSNTSASSAISITGGAATGSGLYLLSTSNASAAGVDFIQLKGNASGATSLMTARGNGNIGIGTVSPYAKLQIIGNIGIGTGQSSSFQGTVPPNGGMIVETNIGIGTVNPGTSLDVNGAIRISNAGDTYFQGNIGLGTTIPMNTLSVLGNVGIGSTKFGGNVCVGGLEVGNSGGLCVSHNVGIGSLIPEGPLIVRSSTNNIGWSVQNAANQACNTTCTAACVFGIDTSAIGNLLACTDASADSCLCAGSN